MLADALDRIVRVEYGAGPTSFRRVGLRPADLFGRTSSAWVVEGPCRSYLVPAKDVFLILGANRELLDKVI